MEKNSHLIHKTMPQLGSVKATNEESCLLCWRHMSGLPSETSNCTHMNFCSCVLWSIFCGMQAHAEHVCLVYFYVLFCACMLNLRVYVCFAACSAMTDPCLPRSRQVQSMLSRCGGLGGPTMLVGAASHVLCLHLLTCCVWLWPWIINASNTDACHDAGTYGMHRSLLTRAPCVRKAVEL